MSRIKSPTEGRTHVRRRSKSGALQKTTPSGESRRLTAGLSALLAVITIAIYSPVAGHRFLIFDDHDYVTANGHIHAGLSRNTIRWAFTSIELANWHPLTWLSHAVDYQLFGLNSSAHHLDSALIHACNVVLLFLLLRWMTGRVGPSLLVAALFAVHPLNVESVAWIAERKNVLSTFFFLAAIGCYAWYAQRPGWRRYLGVLVLFAMGLMAKPVVITLPFVLLLLDYWPLSRIESDSSSPARLPQFSVRRLLLEKVPLSLLSAASAVITLHAQRAGLALRSLEQFSLGVRIENAVVAYATYLAKMLWPIRLAPLYPHGGRVVPAWQVALATIVLLSITASVFAFRRRKYLLAGWLWFLGTLVPVIGIVQVGDATMADRYAYIPLIGVFIMLAFGLADLADAVAVPATWQVAGVGVIVVLAGMTLHQVSYWDSEYDIWSHTLAVTGRNPFAHEALAAALLEPDVAMTPDDLAGLDNEQKRAEAARQHYEAALTIRRELAQQNPNAYLADLATTLNNLGNLDRAEQRMEDARQHYEEAVQIHRELAQKNLDPYLPDMAMALNNLGFLDKAQGQLEQASEYFEEALPIYQQLVPQNPATYLPDVALTFNNLAITQRDLNHPGEARAYYEKGLLIRRLLAEDNPETYLPDVAMTLNDLANVDSSQKRMAEARSEYEEAARIYRGLAQQDPGLYTVYLAGTLNNLGFLDNNEGRWEESRKYYQEAIALYRELARADPGKYEGDVARVEAALEELQKIARTNQ